MADVSSIVKSAVSDILSLIKGLIVFFVFAIILFPGLQDYFNPVQGIMDLVDMFLNGGFTGLLALLFLVSFVE